MDTEVIALVFSHLCDVLQKSDILVEFISHFTPGTVAYSLRDVVYAYWKDNKIQSWNQMLRVLVHNHLCHIAPKTAFKFRNTFHFPWAASYTLEQFLVLYKKKVKHEFDLNTEKVQSNKNETVMCPKKPKASDRFRKPNYRLGVRPNRFTREEDQIILEAIENQGDNIDYPELQKKLGRKAEIIYHRVAKLKVFGEPQKTKRFTVVEDKLIIDYMLPKLKNNRLSDSSVRWLNHREREELGLRLSRNPLSAYNRWKSQIIPILLKHSAGTLNLSIEKMLVNYVAENCENFSDIDWAGLVTRPEFSGHTRSSLRRVLTVFRSSCQQYDSRNRRLLGSLADITPLQVAEYVNCVYQANKKSINKKQIKHQMELIQYFENNMKKEGSISVT